MNLSETLLINTAHKAGRSDEIKPKRAKDKLGFNKRGREDFKEAALKGASWKGKQAVKRMQSQGGPTVCYLVKCSTDISGQQQVARMRIRLGKRYQFPRLAPDSMLVHVWQKGRIPENVRHVHLLNRLTLR